jgi:hypothetical protein
MVGRQFFANKLIESWSTSSLCFSSSALRYETKLKVQLARSQTNYHGQCVCVCGTHKQECDIPILSFHFARSEVAIFIVCLGKAHM